MKDADAAAVETIAAGRGAHAVGLGRLANTKYSEYEQLVAQARTSSISRHTLKEQAQALNASGVSLNLVSFAQAHARDAGIPTAPTLPTRASAFGPP
jgi:uncharacterized protein YbjQ (UPF0145 family)